jgi:hypothetical protein
VEHRAATPTALSAAPTAAPAAIPAWEDDNEVKNMILDIFQPSCRLYSQQYNRKSFLAKYTVIYLSIVVFSICSIFYSMKILRKLAVQLPLFNLREILQLQ